MSELLPCPFCGHKKPRYVSVAIKHERDVFHRIKCDKCGAYGPHMLLKEEAPEEWNKRADGWQPIETAPKDKTEVDLWVDGARLPDCFYDDDGWRLEMNISEVLCDACANLPDGYAVILRMEKGAATVELETPDGIQNVPEREAISKWIKEAVSQAELDSQEE